MFEPTHGSAPDIAGQNRAGPEAMLLTVAMMLDWMGEEDERANKAAQRLRTACARDLQAHAHEKRSTTAVGDAVIAALKAV